MDQKWLLLLLGVNEKQLPAGGYTLLADALNVLIPSNVTGLNLDKLYLITSKQKSRIQRMAHKTALDYHHYAVSIRGEPCTIENCEQHNLGKVLNLYAYHSTRNRKPPGIN
jgi:hypothetical protein